MLIQFNYKFLPLMEQMERKSNYFWSDKRQYRTDLSSGCRRRQGDQQLN